MYIACTFVNALTHILYLLVSRYLVISDAFDIYCAMRVSSKLNQMLIQDTMYRLSIRCNWNIFKEMVMDGGLGSLVGL